CRDRWRRRGGPGNRSGYPPASSRPGPRSIASIPPSEPSPPLSPYPFEPPLQGLDGALFGLRALGIACRPQPGLGRHMADDRSCRCPLGPIAAADHDVVTKLNESAVPTLLARANHSRRLGVAASLLVNLGVDVAGQRPGA